MYTPKVLHNQPLHTFVLFIYFIVRRLVMLPLSLNKHSQKKRKENDGQSN